MPPHPILNVVPVPGPLHRMTNAHVHFSVTRGEGDGRDAGEETKVVTS